MNDCSFTEGHENAQTKRGLHRLRRYSHNRITESVEVMGGRMLNGGNRRTTYFVLSILLVSSLPMLNTVSADIGIPDELQAQDITVSFDNVSETTTVSWRNIEDTAGNFNLYSELWDATYHLYRHTAQITPANIESLNPWTSVTACDQATITQSIDCRGEALGTHEVTYQVGAGTNGTFYYAITTELGNGTITSPLDFGASSLLEPVTEITTPIRSPFNVQATFDPGASQTTIQWINYNSLYTQFYLKQDQTLFKSTYGKPISR